MPTRKKRRHRKRKTYKRGGRILKSVQTTSDGYVDLKIMPSTDNKVLLEKDKFVPSVNTPWLLSSNEAKYANNMLFGKKGEVKPKAMFIVLNDEMEKQQADLYYEIVQKLNQVKKDAENAADAAKAAAEGARTIVNHKAAAQAAAQAAQAAYYKICDTFLLTYFPTPGTVGAAAAPVAPVVAEAAAPVVAAVAEAAAPVVAAEIENLFKKETLWPKVMDNRDFYIPKTLLDTLKNVYKEKLKNVDKENINQLNEIRQLMYEHRTSIYYLIDDKMVETFMDAVDNTNKKYSSIYKKGDTTTYDNIRYVIMWILFKIDIMFLT
jgi:hypothetical protein